MKKATGLHVRVWGAPRPLDAIGPRDTQPWTTADDPPARDDPPVIPPPSTATVEFVRRPVLYDYDGRPLTRRAGF